MNWAKLAAAFLIAPLTPALIIAAPALLFGAPLASVWTMALAICIVTYGHAVALGIPVAWVLGRSGPLSWLRVTVAAFLIGAIPFGGLLLYQESTITPGAGYSSNGVVLREDGRLTGAGARSAIFGVLQLGGLGAATGFVWWLIVKPKARKLTHDG